MLGSIPVTVLLLPGLLAVTRADPLDAWSWRNPLPQGNPLFAVTYGNGRFVAVGGGLGSPAGKVAIVTSADGETWVQQSPSPPGCLVGVAYGNGAFVAVGRRLVDDQPRGIILTSADGETWAEGSLPDGVVLYGVTYGNGLFVAVGWRDSTTGNPDSVFTSPDGVTWVTRIEGSPGSDSWSGVTYGGGLFVAVGFYGATLTSTDGVAWTPGSLGASGGFQSVTYGAGVYVAVGWYGALRMSTDGVTWSAAVSGTANNLYAVTYADGAFVAVGNGWTVLVSPDGSTWTPQTAPAPNWPGLLAVAAGPGQCVAVGHGGMILASTDRTTWASRTGTAADLLDVVFGDGLFLAVGDAGTLLTSPDGDTWTAQSSGTTDALRAAVHADGLFVAVGDAGRILVSANGTDWAMVSSGTTAALHGVTWGNGRFVAVGAWGTVLTSDDASAWFPQASGAARQLCGVAYGDGLFVAVEWNFYTSTDGLTWTCSNWPHPFWFESAMIESVAYGNGRFVGFGNADRISEWAGCAAMSSSDGVTWTFADSLVSHDGWDCWEGHAVTYANGQFMATVGDSWGVASILTSADGLTWRGWPTGVANELHGLAYGNGTLIAVGRSGTILRSVPALEVSKAGTGNGVVASADSRIQCGTACSAGYGRGTVVSLTATAAEGSIFAGWEGADEVNGNQCTVTLAASRTVTATFVSTAVTHTVTFHPGAHGTLAGGTPDVAVTANHDDPAPAAPAVTPEAGWSFTGWAPALPATITADIETTARYAPITCVVSFAFTGDGSLAGTLVQTVPYGGSTTPVTAVPGAGAYFRQWSDGSAASPRTLDNVTADLTLTAEFLPLVEGDPQGHFELVYAEATNPGPRRIWDLTGHYAGAVGAYTLALDLVHDEKGALARVS
jgi:hypothetical protein